MPKRRKHRRRFRRALLILIVAFVLYLFVSGRIELPDGSKSATLKNGWNLILVNSEYTVPDDWEIELVQLSNGQSVDSRIYPELQQMFDDMRAEGIYPEVSSGYRTAEYQQMLMDQKIEAYMYEGYAEEAAEAEAKMWVAEVGHSEHQTGLAVDICSDGVNSVDQDVYSWLAANAYKYGFIYRYPESKIDITGINCEPWHYRYVGTDIAEIIYGQGICLEEYIDMYCD